MKNYGDESVCYQPKPQSRGGKTLRNLHNSLDDTETEFNNCFIIHSK